jgi:hypothetical protein
LLPLRFADYGPEQNTPTAVHGMKLRGSVAERNN